MWGKLHTGGIVLVLVVSTIAVAMPAAGAGGGSSGADIAYSESVGASFGSFPYSEAFNVERTGNGTLNFGPGVSNRIRIRKTSTGEQVTLAPRAGEPTLEIDRLNVNDKNFTPSTGTATISIADPNSRFSSPVDVRVTGDVGLFETDTFAPYVIEVVDGNGTVIAATQPRIHGTGYGSPADNSNATGIQYNGSALAVLRDSEVDEDWYVVLKQTGMEIEIDNSAGEDYFVVSTAGTNFDPNERFLIEIYRNESDPVGDRLLSISRQSVGSSNRISGPVGDSNSSSTVVDRYDTNGQAGIQPREAQAAIVDLNNGQLSPSEAQTIVSALNA